MTSATPKTSTGLSPPPDKRLPGLGRQIREVFVRRKTALEPLWKLQPRQDRPQYWQQAAQNSLDMTMSPEDYVDLFFHGMHDPMAVYPASISSEALAKSLLMKRLGLSGTPKINIGFEELVESLVTDIRDDFSSAVELVMRRNEGRYKIGVKEIDLLLHPFYQVPPIVAYCLTYPDPYMISVIGARVRKQYFASVGLQEALRRLDINPVIFGQP